MRFPNRCRFATFVAVACALLMARIAARPQEREPRQLAHFHHLHLNSTDPEAAIKFYTTHFDCERAKFGGAMDAVRSQNSWILFNQVDQPPPSEIVSALYHFGWGAEDMKAAYEKQVGMGTKFRTPITDINETTGWGRPGAFYYAYVEGPDHAMIELNTANHHHFGHIHMLSADPIAAGEWYMKEFGMTRRGQGALSREPYFYKGRQLGPSISLMMDDVSFVIFPVEFARTAMPKEWTGRKTFESPKGRVMDHFAFSVDNLEETLARLKKDGVKVTRGPHTMGGGKWKAALIEGPDNVQIELVAGQTL